MKVNRQAGNKKSPLWVLGVIGTFLLSQMKVILPLLKLGKFGGAIVSMFVSIWAYALVSPLSFAIGLVVMLFIHEMGHVLAAKRKKLPVSAPVFIPFVGALITMRKHPSDAITEAYVAFGGPLLGTLGAVCTLGLGYILDSPILLSISYLGFYLNLINLLPIHPLDGGRISTAVTRWLWLVGLVGGLYVILHFRIYLLLLFWASFAYDLYKKFVKDRGRKVVLTAEAQFEHPAQHLVEQGYIIPGEEHVRDLPFTTFSEIGGSHEGAQTIEMYWEGIGFVGRIELGRQAIIKRVSVYRVGQINHYDGLGLKLHCRVEYSVYENDRYYEVPTATRWKFGISYVSLALLLFYCIHLVHVIEKM